MSNAGTQACAAVGSAGGPATQGADITDAQATNTSNAVEAANTADATHPAEASSGAVVSAVAAEPNNPATAPAASSSNGQSLQPPPTVPTQQGPAGIRFDFNDGCRVTLPAGDGEWRVLLRDTATANPLFETQLAAGAVASSKKYYVPFEIEVWSQGKEVFRHRLDLSGRQVLVHLPVGTLGDTLGWFPYVARFQQQHRCRLTCVMGAP